MLLFEMYKQICVYGALYTPNDATLRFSRCEKRSLCSRLGTTSGEKIAGARAILRSMKNKPIEVQHFTLRDEFIELNNLDRKSTRLNSSHG